jgi:YspA, cpYpsA-related SLOG family
VVIEFREFMQGGARGADALAKDWAMTHPDIKRFEIKADWKRYGNAAGPIRNQRMLEWGPDLVVAFAGGTGTAGMVALARAAGVPVIEP